MSQYFASFAVGKIIPLFNYFAKSVVDNIFGRFRGIGDPERNPEQHIAVGFIDRAEIDAVVLRTRI